MADFPDKDIVVDDVENGVHSCDEVGGWRCPVESEGGSSESEREEDQLDSDHSVQREKLSKKDGGGMEKGWMRRASVDSVKSEGSKCEELVEKESNDSEKETSHPASPIATQKSPVPDKSPLPNKETSEAAVPPLPLESKAPSSSSSGSTCSSTSAGKPAANEEKEKVEVKPADEKPKSKDKDEKKDPQPTSPSTTPVKKHRPLSIKISLPKRKRPEEEGKTAIPASGDEPVKKKVKNVDETSGHFKADDVEMKVEASTEMKLDTSKPISSVKPSANDDSDSDGEIKEKEIEVRSTTLYFSQWIYTF